MIAPPAMLPKANSIAASASISNITSTPIVYTVHLGYLVSKMMMHTDMTKEKTAMPMIYGTAAAMSGAL